MEKNIFALIFLVATIANSTAQTLGHDLLLTFLFLHALSDKAVVSANMLALIMK